ncbi:MAG: hypothetical protein LBH40_02995 [Alphaproteobacteria bacterium]|jgi:GTPase Era involved in 16S rRNA processing|nr:hypothetical protein [Alphaproteobacteria bacterium]
MLKYKDRIIGDIYRDYRELFEKVKSDDYSKNALRELIDPIVDNLKEYTKILVDANKIETSLEYKRETVKEFLNFELKLNEIALEYTKENIGAYESLAETRKNLKNTIDYYDRDMLNSDNYQASYTRNIRTQATYAKGLPKDNVVFILHSQTQKIIRGSVMELADSNPFYEINNKRGLVIEELKMMYKAIQKELLKDVLPLEQTKNKKRIKNDFER